MSYFKVFPKLIFAFTSKLQTKQAFNDESRVIVCIEEKEYRLKRKLCSSICAKKFICSNTYSIEKGILMNLCMKLITFGKYKE